MIFSEEKISELYQRVRGEMSDFRFSHTAGVEKAAILLGELYMPEAIDELRVAALLHLYNFIMGTLSQSVISSAVFRSMNLKSFI